MQRTGSGTMDHAMLVTLEPEGPSYANTRLSGLMDVAGGDWADEALLMDPGRANLQKIPLSMI
jgi:hypothetical protein